MTSDATDDPTPRDSAHGGRRTIDARGLTTPIGVVLVLAIVVLGTLTIVSTGSSTLRESQQRIELDRAENALLALDSHAAGVALDTTSAQSVSLGGSGGGRYDVVDDAGWVRIVHHDYVNGSDEIVYDGSLGAVVYRNGDATVAYQGGGVWRSRGDHSRMVAPPEFHYRRETLVFPIVSVGGSESTTGSHRAVVTPGESDLVYPDAGVAGATGPGAPYDDTGAPYRNPIKDGTVTVTVHSDYYEAWGRYFDRRTGGAVAVDHSAETVTVELTAPTFVGDFDMPAEGGYIPIRGMESDHGLEDFTVTLAPDDSDAASFDNLKWSMYVNDGRQTFELHLRLTGPDDDKATACKEQSVAATIYYSDTNGARYDGWRDPTAFRTTCVDRDDDGEADEVQLRANLTGNASLTMADLSDSDVMYAGLSGATRNATVAFDQHDVDGEPVTFTDGGTNTAPMGFLLAHYMSLLGSDYNLYVEDKNSDTVNEDDSYGTLYYDSHGRVTFMHVTHNPIVIELE